MQIHSGMQVLEDKQCDHVESAQYGPRMQFIYQTVDCALVSAMNDFMLVSHHTDFSCFTIILRSIPLNHKCIYSTNSQTDKCICV